MEKRDEMIAPQIEASYESLTCGRTPLKNLQHGDRAVWLRTTESNQTEEIGYVARNAENDLRNFQLDLTCTIGKDSLQPSQIMKCTKPELDIVVVGFRRGLEISHIYVGRWCSHEGGDTGD